MAVNAENAVNNLRILPDPVGRLNRVQAIRNYLTPKRIIVGVISFALLGSLVFVGHKVVNRLDENERILQDLLFKTNTVGTGTQPTTTQTPLTTTTEITNTSHVRGSKVYLDVVMSILQKAKDTENYTDDEIDLQPLTNVPVYLMERHHSDQSVTTLTTPPPTTATTPTTTTTKKPVTPNAAGTGKNATRSG